MPFLLARSSLPVPCPKNALSELVLVCPKKARAARSFPNNPTPKDEGWAPAKPKTLRGLKFQLLRSWLSRFRQGRKNLRSPPAPQGGCGGRPGLQNCRRLDARLDARARPRVRARLAAPAYLTITK